MKTTGKGEVKEIAIERDKLGRVLPGTKLQSLRKNRRLSTALHEAMSEETARGIITTMLLVAVQPKHPAYKTVLPLLWDRYEGRLKDTADDLLETFRESIELIDRGDNRQN